MSVDISNCEYVIFPYAGKYLGGMEYGSIEGIGISVTKTKIQNVKVKINGTWVPVIKVWLNRYGYWGQVNLSVKVNGEWKLIHERTGIENLLH
jgi:hypothetical protein